MFKIWTECEKCHRPRYGAVDDFCARCFGQFLRWDDDRLKDTAAKMMRRWHDTKGKTTKGEERKNVNPNEIIDFVQRGLQIVAFPVKVHKTKLKRWMKELT